MSGRRLVRRLDRKELERAIEMVARSRLAKTVNRPNDRPMRNKTYLDCEVERIKRQLSEFRPILRVFRGAEQENDDGNEE